jgi:hypothetical protein
VAAAGHSLAGSLSLAWDPSPDPDIIGYTVWYGTATGQWTDALDVGAATTAAVDNLTPGNTYYFVVIARNSAALESVPSNEVSGAVADGSPTPTPTPAPTPEPSPTPTATPFPTPEPTPTATATPFPTPEPTPTATSTPFPTPEPTPVATATPFPTPDPTPTAFPTPSPTPFVSPSPNATPSATQSALLNVSTRGTINGGDGVLIGGFIVVGDTPKTVVIRGIGPSLIAHGVNPAMPDPTLALHDGAGTLVRTVRGWQEDAAELEAAGLVPEDLADSAMVVQLQPGSYTAVISSATNGVGTALFELYDLEPSNSRIANISTRGTVNAGDDVLVGGLIIGGADHQRVLIRAIGPTLRASGVPDALPDPVLGLYGANGTLIYSNDSWRSTQEVLIQATTLAPADDLEPAILAALPPGPYTAVVRSNDGSVGVALVEIYHLVP